VFRIENTKFKMFSKLFKKSKNGKFIQSLASSNPPDYNQFSIEQYVRTVNKLIIRVGNVNRDLETVESDKKRGSLPAYESERDHNLRKLIDNYGIGGGIAPGVGCPKIPVFPPREKKHNQTKSPKYPV
jgi:hypothetical protein